MIQVSNLNKKFKNGKGVFDLNFNVDQGEVFGFIGPNGAGKSTTIRHLMGFLKADKGTAKIAGYDCWSESEKVKSRIGYLPGEISFPEGVSANEFIKLQMGIRNISDDIRVKDLIDRFNLNIKIPIKNMSKGMKQKLAIVATFMGNPDVILLDEPSTGLDPLMQKELINLFKEEKKKGKTLFLSSHIFEEIENVADTICIVRDGKIVEYEKFEDIHKKMLPMLIVDVERPEELDKIKIPFKTLEKGRISIEIMKNENQIFKQLTQVNIKNIDVKKVTLNEIFEKYYVQDKIKY